MIAVVVLSTLRTKVGIEMNKIDAINSSWMWSAFYFLVDLQFASSLICFTIVGGLGITNYFVNSHCINKLLAVAKFFIEKIAKVFFLKISACSNLVC